MVNWTQQSHHSTPIVMQTAAPCSAQPTTSAYRVSERVVNITISQTVSNVLVNSIPSQARF